MKRRRGWAGLDTMFACLIGICLGLALWISWLSVHTAPVQAP